jgi:hypothetical protein
MRAPNLDDIAITSESRRKKRAWLTPKNLALGVPLIILLGFPTTK